MYISCKGITKDGILCQNVDVELDLSGGLFTFLIVGLADKCIGESRERIISAIKNSGFDSPKTKNHKITVSLVPAGIKKEGVLLDLPIALAYLAATGKIKQQYLDGSIFIGELGLDGSIKSNDSLASVVNFILQNKQTEDGGGVYDRKKTINLYSNFKDDQMDLIEQLNPSGIKLHSVKNLKDLIVSLDKDQRVLVSPAILTPAAKPALNQSPKPVKSYIIDENNSISFRGTNRDREMNFDRGVRSFEIDKIIGQEKAKRALLISICGKYNMIMSGPPGVGKTMLAKSAHQLLPPPKPNEFLEILSIHNKLGRPFRSPHHTSSYSSIVGGGTPIIAGEITKAHKGILFLDELPEFNKNVMESLRQPLEEKVIQINRSNETITLPCDVICICAMNLCPCGKSGVPNRECVCGGNKINLYKQKVSEPFLERFHISIVLPYEKRGFKESVELVVPTLTPTGGLSTEDGRHTNTSSCARGKYPSMNGQKMHEITNKFNDIKSCVDFVWNNSILELLHKESEKRLFSMRVTNHIKEISETICLIENIQNNIKISNIPATDMTEIRVNIEGRHVVEALLYKNSLLA